MRAMIDKNVYYEINKSILHSTHWSLHDRWTEQSFVKRYHRAPERMSIDVTRTTKVTIAIKSGYTTLKGSSSRTTIII